MIPLEKTFGEHFKLGKVVNIKTTDKQVCGSNGVSLK